MCVYSMIVDHYWDKWIQPQLPMPDYPVPPPEPVKIKVEGNKITIVQQLTPEELEDFRKDVKELKELLKRAKEYDKKNNQPECELEVKKDKLRNLAKELGVEIEFP